LAIYNSRSNAEKPSTMCMPPINKCTSPALIHFYSLIPAFYNGFPNNPLNLRRNRYARFRRMGIAA
jgi:hypothetical protein